MATGSPESTDFNFDKTPTSDFLLLSELGKGAFGLVFEAINKTESGKDNKYALKKICIERVLILYKGWISIPKIYREVENWRELHHPNIVTYVNSWLEGPDADQIKQDTYKPPDITSTSPIPEVNFLWIQMECCDITLEQWIKANLKPSEPSGEQETKLEIPVEIFVQLLSGLEAIHNRKILHRDIQLGNIFLKGSNWKIGDFGLSRDNTDSEEDKSSRKGMALFQSPEMCRGSKNYGYPTDIYSLGLVFLILINRKLQTDEYFKRYTFYELREGPDPDTAIVEVADGVEEDYAIELGIVREMIQRVPSERIFLKKAIYKFEDRFQFDLLTSGIKLQDSKVNHGVIKHCENFIHREQEVMIVTKQFENLDKSPTGVDNLNIISIRGESSSGKSELARKIGRDFYNRYGSCVWICCKDIIRNFKLFIKLRSSLSSPWVIIFDDVNKTSAGCFKLILETLVGPKCKLKPAVVIVTSVNEISFDFLSQGHIEGVTLTPILLDYDWVKQFIFEEKLNLKSLMWLVFKPVVNSPNTSADLRQLIPMIYESFGLLTPSLSVVKTSLTLVILLGYVAFNQTYSKDEFMYFWRRLCSSGNCGYTVRMQELDTVLAAFIKNGVICCTEPLSESDSSVTSSSSTFGIDTLLSQATSFLQKFRNNLATEVNEAELYKNRDENKYLTTLACETCYRIILKHPMIHYILREVLGIEPTEVGILKKILETYRTVLNLGERKYIGSFHFSISLKWADRICGNDQLLLEFPSELAEHFAIDSTYEGLNQTYEKYLGFFGPISENTLKVGRELAKDLRDKVDEGSMNKLVLLSTREYKGLEERVGKLDKKTVLKAGGKVVEQIHRKVVKGYMLTEDDIRICREVYQNVAEYFGLLVEAGESVKAKWAHILLNIGKVFEHGDLAHGTKNEALDVYDFVYRFYLDEAGIVELVTERRDKLVL